MSIGQSGRATALVVIVGIACVLGWGMNKVSGELAASHSYSPPLPVPAKAAPLVATKSRDVAAKAPVETDALKSLNSAFRGAYSKAREDVLSVPDPVIVFEGESVVLLVDKKREEKRFQPAIYDHLKTMAHVPMALYLLIEPQGYGTLDAKRLERLKAYRKRLEAARASLGIRGFSPEQEKRQQEILTASMEFIDQTEKRKTVQLVHMGEYILRMRPLIDANIREAANAQLDALHAQVMAWKAAVPTDQWKRLRVVVMGGHTPRTGNFATQYFSRLLGEPLDDRRLVYAESLWDEKDSVNLLGRCVLDSEISHAFFGDRQRLFRDLLSDAAEKHIGSLSFPAR